METQFKIIGYSNSRDYKFNKNGIEITDIETLLKYVNKCYYWTCDGKEVQPSENWDIVYNELDELTGSPIEFIKIIEMPTDTKLRIIGTSIFSAIPQLTGKSIFNNLEEVNHEGKILEECMSLYPYTMNEFIYLLANSRSKLMLSTYNYVAILNN